MKSFDAEMHFKIAAIALTYPSSLSGLEHWIAILDMTYLPIRHAARLLAQ